MTFMRLVRQTIAGREGNENVGLTFGVSRRVFERRSGIPSSYWFNGIARSLSRASPHPQLRPRTADAGVHPVCACVGAGSFILPRISIDRLQFTNAETCWIYRHSATLSLRNPLPSVIFSSTRRPPPPIRLRSVPLRSSPLLAARIFTLQSERGLGTSLVIIVN